MSPKPNQPEPPIDSTEAVMIDEFLSATEARQAIALNELETRLDEMGDAFASKVRTMVERGLIAARGKALREIRTIDVGFFLQAPLSTLNGHEPHTLNAHTEEI